VSEESVGSGDWLGIFSSHAKEKVCDGAVDNNAKRIGGRIRQRVYGGPFNKTPINGTNVRTANKGLDYRVLPKKQVREGFMTTLRGASGQHCERQRCHNTGCECIERAANHVFMPNVEVNRSKEGAAPAPQEMCLTQESVPTIGSA
jgi:hypothetical protein